MKRLHGLVLLLAFAMLPGCGAAGLLAPLIDKAFDEIFDNDGPGDKVKDDTEIGQAVGLEISLGGLVCCDPADGVNQKVATITIQHTGPNGSDPVTFNFIPETATNLSAMRGDF